MSKTCESEVLKVVCDRLLVLVQGKVGSPQLLLLLLLLALCSNTNVKKKWTGMWQRLKGSEGMGEMRCR